MIRLLRVSLRRKPLPALWVLVLMVSVGPFGDTEYTPSLPRIAHDFGVSYGAVQQSMTVYLLAYALGQLFYGPWSDRIGRRPVALSGALLFVGGSAFCWLSTDLTGLLAGRVLQGLGACGGAVISAAMVRDAFPRERIDLVYTRINAAFALAPGIGPMVGAVVDARYGWQANMLILLALGILLFLVVLLFANETHAAEQHYRLSLVPFCRSYVRLFRHADYLPAILINGLAIGTVYTALTEAPSLIIDSLGMGSHAVALVALVVLLAFVSGSLVNLRLRVRRTAGRIIRLGLLLMLTGALVQGAIGLAGRVSLPGMLVPVAVVFVGIALVVPNATGVAMRPFQHSAGTASAMLGFSQMALAGAANAAVSLLPWAAPLAMPAIFLILAGLAMIVYVVGTGRFLGRAATAFGDADPPVHRD